MSDKIRNEVKRLYPHSGKWAARVDRMFDQQVYAIYMNAVKKQNAVEDRTPPPVIHKPELFDPEQLFLNLDA